MGVGVRDVVLFDVGVEFGLGEGVGHDEGRSDEGRREGTNGLI